MKLNAGCGKEKLKGYINIDINPLLKPDYVMPLWDIDFNDNTFDEILSKNVIEHLGFFKTRYFLSEAMRTLKYEKFLIIETVNLEQSFKLFLDLKEESDKERVLSWIFGSETKYMNHIFCFPKELLLRLIKESGFEVIGVEDFMYEYLRPCVRYKCVKRKTDLKESYLRKTLVKNGFLESDNEIVFSEIERIINSIVWDKIDKKYLYEMCFISPLFSYEISKYVKDENPDFYYDLFKKNITGYIWENFKKNVKLYGTFELAFERVKKEFFDNPYQFIYNFMEKKTESVVKKFIITETVLRYDFELEVI